MEVAGIKWFKPFIHKLYILYQPSPQPPKWEELKGCTEVVYCKNWLQNVQADLTYEEQKVRQLYDF
jgi:hypothetical protein